jgi:DNA-binding NtrC family response regulator
MSASLLIVDDEQTIRKTLRFFFEKKRYEVFEAETGASALEMAESCQPDVVLLDVKLPDMDGLDVLPRLREAAPGSVVLMMTAHGDAEMAREAIRRRGAFWFFSKPIDMVMLELQVDQALEHAQALRDGRLERKRAEKLEPRAPSLGESDAMKAVDEMVSVVSESPDTTVLVLGESGTGKGVVASAVHERSGRRDKPFQEINCAGLSETFLHSELFGAERGAYTDAKSLKRGLLEIADGGTVFLDEIGDLAMPLQPKLLKVLESKSFRRLGGTKDIEVDVRLVAATNKELAEAVTKGEMRQDLYYRLNVMQIVLPPLRERGQDVLLLADRFLEHFRGTIGKGVEAFSADAEQRLLAHAWPGNVRELKNVVERGVILCRGAEIGVEHLPAELGGGGGAAAGPVLDPGDILTLEEVERRYVAQALQAKDRNRSQTAKALGISRSTLIEKIKKYGLA